MEQDFATSGTAATEMSEPRQNEYLCAVLYYLIDRQTHLMLADKSESQEVQKSRGGGGGGINICCL